jgi:MFS family permease
VAEYDIEFDRHVAKHFRWNFSANVMDISFYMLATNLVSQATIMPLLVSQLTTSKLAIGLIPAIFSLGFLLPQLLTANFTERLRFKKPFVVIVSGPGERGPYLVSAIVLWLLAVSQPTLTLVLFYALLAVSAVSAGVAMPAWSDLIAKVIPVKRRGRWSGTAYSLGALMGVVGASFAGRILAGYPFATNFALCFLLASGAMFVSWVGLAINREPAGLIVKPHVTLGDYFRQLPGLLHQDHNYVRFLISRSIANLGGMAAGFIMVYGTQRFGFGGREVGIMTAILAGSQAVMNPLWGLLGDRAGHKIVLCAAAFAMLAATAATALAVSPAGIYLAFALLGVAMAADSVSAMNIIMEFGAPQDRPTYIGLSNTLLAPGRSLAPIIGGILATVVGYGGMFAVAMVLAGAGGLLLALWVRDPRHAQRGEMIATT